MKRLFFIPILLIALLSFSSCEQDDSLDPRPLIVNGQYMRLDITRDRIDFNNISTSSFGGMLTNPSNTVVRYELFVRWVRSGELSSEYIPLKTITSFPVDLAITAQDVQDAYAAIGRTITIQQGDILRFIAYSYDAKGVRAGYRDLSATIRGEPAYKQAYKFNTSVETNLTSPINNYQTTP
ncbi:hypothetical protein G4D82_00140 [Flavobacterium sp. CYK-4]|uniref:hypothetical protein n=1 Tax=Flavobacterium lotistagni TaxID=2709660 RepID=UPI001408C360|nr:hypothetical protein [Flavobacterium lotistagni]NHM05617.1 hypothetical protein [Flavobacterium lotistagni]